MKKIFALALAAVMTAGMTTVAFAADGVKMHYGTDDVIYLVDLDDNGVFDATKGEQFTEQTIDNSGAEGGEKVAVLLYTDANAYATKDDVKGFKVYADWLINEPTDKAAIDEIVYKGGDSSVATREAVVFTLPEMDENKAIDLVGNLNVYKSSANKTANLEAIKIKIGTDAVEYDGTNDFNNGPVKFSNYDDVEVLSFGDEIEFEVSLSGQGKLNLAWNTDFNKEFGDMYDYANIDFLTFEYAPSFNKNGTVYLYAPEDAFVYEVTADGAKEINGLKWDEDYEAWTFKTRTLGSYAISDVELDEKTVVEDKDDTTTDGGKENPDTGR